ncbi:MAG: hypothetical protein LUE11_12460 [Clostridia bacterium]|nr:hypothetical protein [Clostridia bacterium]
MKKKCRNVFVGIVLMVVFFPILARADMGPKPSVQVSFTGLENETYYVTLLSEAYSTGPATAYNGNEADAYLHMGEEDYEIWKKFVEYSDSDGYFFLQWFEKCEGNDTYIWGYYPPSPFKILIYFPESDIFAVSSIYERYAFDSYFTAEISAVDGGTLVVKKSYDLTWEAISLLARIIITIVVEILLALLFHFRAKKQLQIVIVTNLITQIVLNLLLNTVNYVSGSRTFTFYYIILEAIIIGIEAVLYTRLLPKHSMHIRPVHPILYALTANVVSFGIGLSLAHLIPGIF